MPRKKESVSRLESYPKWLWEVFDAAKAGRSYARVFPASNFAVNAMHRYHSFRKDLIRERIPGASILTEMPCSRPAPDELQWTFIGDLASYAEDFVESVVPVGTGRSGTQPEVRSRVQDSSNKDAGEEATERWLSSPKPPTSDIPQAELDIPALDASSKGEPTPPCPPHELDVLTDCCAKCRKPRNLW